MVTRKHIWCRNTHYADLISFSVTQLMMIRNRKSPTCSSVCPWGNTVTVGWQHPSRLVVSLIISSYCRLWTVTFETIAYQCQKCQFVFYSHFIFDKINAFGVIWRKQCVIHHCEQLLLWCVKLCPPSFRYTSNVSSVWVHHRSIT